MDSKTKQIFADNLLKIVKLTQNIHPREIKLCVEELCDAYYYEADIRYAINGARNLWEKMHEYQNDFTEIPFDEMRNCCINIKDIEQELTKEPL